MSDGLSNVPSFANNFGTSHHNAIAIAARPWLKQNATLKSGVLVMAESYKNRWLERKIRLEWWNDDEGMKIRSGMRFRVAKFHEINEFKRKIRTVSEDGIRCTLMCRFLRYDFDRCDCDCDRGCGCGCECGVGIARLIFNAEVVQICQKVAYSQFVIPRLIYQIIL